MNELGDNRQTRRHFEESVVLARKELYSKLLEKELIEQGGENGWLDFSPPEKIPRLVLSSWQSDVKAMMSEGNLTSITSDSTSTPKGKKNENAVRASAFGIAQFPAATFKLVNEIFTMNALGTLIDCNEKKAPTANKKKREEGSTTEKARIEPLTDTK